jgi:uncharacterized protein (DUF4415 family)
MSTKNKALKYGKVELDADEFDKKHCKVRVTMMIDEDVVESFRSEAVKRHVGYQTLMNQKLRESISDQNSLEQRLEALEKIVLKKLA